MAFSNGKPSFTQPMAEINTTPLVDVMLVLLVIFIITAPLFQQAIPVDLPKVDSGKLDDQPQVIHFAINADGNFYIDDKALAATELSSALRQKLIAGKEAPELHLRADRATRYEKVTEVMGAAQQLGITKIAFVTDAADAM